MIYAIGHKNPDTDSIVSPIVWADFRNKRGLKIIPARCGELNKETEFVLKTFKVKEPKLIKKVKPTDKLIILDHNVYDQAVDGAREAEIIEVLDHHYIGDFRTDKPIYYRSEPVGSTSTIIAEIFQEKGYRVSKKEASLLLSGIISDTILLKSPTTTEIDKKIVKELNKIAKLELKKFAFKMFKEKSDISGLKISEIIFKDYKEYEFSGKKIGFGIWETLDISPLQNKEKEILEILRKEKKKRELDFLFFGLVDIYKKSLYLYLLSEEERKLAEKSFSFKNLSENLIFVPGVVSRKKQIIPSVSKALLKI